MPISLRCPGCGKGYQLHDTLGGKRVKCRCGTVMAVSAAAADSREAYRKNADPTSAPAENLPLRRVPHDRGSDRRRIVIGVLSIVYGIAMVPLIPATELSMDPLGIVKTLTRVALAVMIAVGGVLILKRHQHGPACAGLGCLFLCFFPAWKLVLALLSTLTTGALMDFVAVLLASVVLYWIPVLITIWSIKQETAKNTDTGPPL